LRSPRVAAGQSLITGIIGGLVVGWLAGSPLQVSGPAAGLAVLVFELVRQHGMLMLGPILLLAGFLQLVAGRLRLGAGSASRRRRWCTACSRGSAC
jgi:MFS superfamily sulfate permease-like transporter